MMSAFEPFYAFFEATPAAVLAVDAGGRVVFANERCEALFGAPAIALVDLDAARLVPERFAGVFDGPTAGGRWVEMAVRAADGSERPVFALLSTLTPPGAAQAVPGLLVATFIDLAAQPAVERANTASLVFSAKAGRARDAITSPEVLFRGLIETARDAIVIASLEGKIILANPSAAALLGAPSHLDMPGKPILSYVAPDYLDQLRRSLSRLVARREGFQDEMILARPDGSHVPVEVSISMAFDREGGPYAFMLVFRDITRRKEAEAQLLKLSRAMAHSPSAVVIMDRYGVIEYINERYVQLIGYAAADLLGKHITLLFSGLDGAEAFDQMLAGLAEGGSWSAEFAERHKDGTPYWMQASVSPVLDERGTITNYVFVAEDITERRKVSEELRRAKDAAEAANRAKSEFLANMSHEIRTPMNAITGLTHLVLQTDLNDVQLGFINKIQSSAQGLLRVINDILDFSRVEAGKLIIESVEFDLDQVLENLSVLTSLRAQEKGLELLFSRAPTVPDRLVGDPSRLLQILTNLANNAIKFTEKGEVLIKTELVGMNPPRGTGPLGAGQAMLKFTVQDTGMGMTPEQIGRLFQPFSQGDTSTSRRFGGTGLGLAICQQLVTLMGGKIQVDSTPGVGSTFSFTAGFGLHKRPADEDLLQTHVLYELLRGLKVLVVDDNLHARDILEQYLSYYTRQVNVAGSGLEAIAELERAAADPYGLLVIDQEMPGLDGVRTLRSLRDKDRYRALPVILMLPSYGEGERPAGSDAPAYADLADTLLYKPINPSRLYDALVEVLGRRSLPRLPAAPAPAPVAQPPAPPEDPMRALRGARLLIVEDNVVNQEMTRRLLESAGFVVMAAGSGKQALNLLEAHDFDGVLMDIHMPIMDGLETTRNIRAEPRFDALPVIALTANVFDDMRRRCEEVGMNAFVTKPVNLDELFGALRKWITPRSLSDESPAAPAHPPGPTSPDVETLMQELARFLEENDTRATRVVAGLKLRVSDPAVQSDLALLEKLISRYNYDSAIKLLEPLAEKLEVSLKGAPPAPGEDG